MFLYTNIFSLLRRVGASACGWFIASATFFTDMLTPEWFAFAVVLTVIVLDAVFGTIVSIQKKRGFALSKLGRVTSFKILSYGSSLLVVFLIEKLIHDDGFIGIKVAAAWAAACEFWSMSASILIIWPEAPFFRMMRRALKGEMSAKLGVPVEDILDEKGAN